VIDRAVGTRDSRGLSVKPRRRRLSSKKGRWPDGVQPAGNPAEVRHVRVRLIALTFVLLSTPQVINAFRLLPVLVPLVLVAGHLLAPKREQLLVTRVPVVLWGLVLWLFATCLWSDGKTISLIQCVATALVLRLAVLIGSHCSLREVLTGVIVGGLAVLMLSLAVAALDPSAGLMPAGYQDGALRGIYVHRNLLAEMLTPPIVAVLSYDFARPFAAEKRLACLLPLIGGVLLTRSSTAVAAVFSAIVIAVVFAVVRRFPLGFRTPALVLAFGGGGAALVALLTHPGTAYALLQRDETFNGRSLIWAAVTQSIGEHPLAGHGWGATWDVGAPVRLFVEGSVNFDVPSAHNGYLDTWLQAGLVGLTLFLLLIATVLLTGLRRAVMSRSTEMTWGPLFVVSLLVYNVAESSLVSAMSILLLATTATVQRTVLSPRVAGAAEDLPVRI
jgi:exopolysaccharide production protein ExoQ